MANGISVTRRYKYSKMSTVLLTITCSIMGVFKCLDCRHNLFFITIYYQNMRSTWEYSSCLTQSSFSSVDTNLSTAHSQGWSIAFLIGNAFPGCDSVKDSRWPAYDVWRYGVSPLFSPELHMQIGLCQHCCQTPVAHNEVTEEPCLIFMTQRSTCTDRKHSPASTWWDVNSNTAALLGQVMQNTFRKRDSAQSVIKYVIHTAYLHTPLTSLPSCISHYTSAKGSHNLVFGCCLWLYLYCNLEEKTYFQLLSGRSKSTLKLWRL